MAVTETALALTRIERVTAFIEVRGTAPLIVNAWSQKARQQILDKHMGKRVAKTVKVPEENFNASRYVFADGSGDGFPIMAFKKATVQGGGRIFGKSVKMTELRQNLLFIPDGLGTDGMQLVALTGGAAVMREDMVRNQTTVDIRHRAMYEEWGAVLQVQFISSLIDVGSIVALIDAGGTNGVGEWRPEKNGAFGTYEVVAA
jgi:hypothetical protein